VHKDEQNVTLGLLVEERDRLFRKLDVVVQKRLEILGAVSSDKYPSYEESATRIGFELDVLEKKILDIPVNNMEDRIEKSKVIFESFLNEQEIDLGCDYIKYIKTCFDDMKSL